MQQRLGVNVTLWEVFARIGASIQFCFLILASERNTPLIE